MSVTVKLRSPIKAHGDVLTELTLREPRGKDIAACGMPRTFGQRGKQTFVEINASAIYDYLVELAGIPPTSVDQITAADWNDLSNAILGFFAPTESAGAAPVGDQPGAPVSDASQVAKVQMPFQDPST